MNEAYEKFQRAKAYAKFQAAKADASPDVRQIGSRSVAIPRVRNVGPLAEPIVEAPNDKRPTDPVKDKRAPVAGSSGRPVADPGAYDPEGLPPNPAYRDPQGPDLSGVGDTASRLWDQLHGDPGQVFADAAQEAARTPSDIVSKTANAARIANDYAVGKIGKAVGVPVPPGTGPISGALGTLEQGYRQPEPTTPGGQLGRAVGNLGVMVGAPALAGAGRVAALSTAAGIGAVDQGVANYYAAGGDKGGDKAFAAFLNGLGLGGAGAVVPLDRLNKATGGSFAKALAEVAIFGGAASAQTALNDAMMEGITGEDLPILKNAVDAGIFGALTGAIATGLTHVVMSGAESRTEQTSPGKVDLPKKPDASFKVAEPESAAVDFNRGDDMPPEATFPKAQAELRGDDMPPDAGLGMFKETPEEAALSRIAARMKKAEDAPLEKKSEIPPDSAEAPLAEPAPPLAEAKAPEQTTEAPVGKPEQVSGEAALTVRGDGGAALPKAALPEPPASKGKGVKVEEGKQPWEMARGEFEHQYWQDANAKVVNVRGTPVARSILDNLFHESSHYRNSVEWTVRDIRQAITDLKGGRQSKAKQRAIEYLESKGPSTETLRRGIVEQAIARGENVPPEVLADYPDLAPSPKPAPTESEVGAVPEAAPDTAAKIDAALSSIDKEMASNPWATPQTLARIQVRRNAVESAKKSGARLVPYKYDGWWYVADAFTGGQVELPRKFDAFNEKTQRMESAITGQLRWKSKKEVQASIDAVRSVEVSEAPKPSQAEPKPASVPATEPSTSKPAPEAPENVAEQVRENLPRRNGKIDARAMKRAGWKWMGGVYTGDPGLKATKYLGDGWFKGKDYRLISGMNDGLAESESPLDRKAMSRGPSLQVSAGRSESRWILEAIAPEPAKAIPASPSVPAEMPKGAKLGTDLTGEPVYSKKERGDFKPERAPQKKVTQIGAFDEQGGMFEAQAAERDSGVKAKNPEPEPKPKNLDPLKVPTVRAMLEGLTSEIGQAEYGGEFAKATVKPDVKTGKNSDEGVAMRWLSKGEVQSASTWWNERPDSLSEKGGQIKAESATNAIRKALAGEKLTADQTQFVNYAISEIERRNGASFHDIAENDALIAKDNLEREAIQNEGRLKNKVVEVAPGVSFLIPKSPWDVFSSAGIRGDGPLNPKKLLPDGDGKYVPREETNIEASIRRVADRFNTLRRVEKEAPNPGDFSGAETRMHGRAAAKQRRLEREQNRAVEIMRANKITVQDMADLANARHAAARDAVILARSGKENGSGIDPAKAKAILAKATPEQLELMRIHDRVRDRTRAFMVESGLISQETADAWQKTFGDTYTPLKTIEDPGTPYVRGSGKSLNTRGKEAHRAEGRETEADNPFVQMFQDAQEAIARGEKNIVGQAFGKLVDANPSTAWERVEPAHGETKPSGEDIFTYKIDGKEQYIKVNDETTLRALKNLDPVVSNQLFRTAMTAARVMSGLATSRNPDFVLPNFARDLQTIAANASVEQGPAIAARVVKDSFKATWQIHRALKNPDAAQGYAKEYIEGGALTDWIAPESINTRLKDLNKRLKESDPKRALREVGDVLNNISSAVENGTRFALYKELRKLGVPADKAAVFAKESSVNWSKKGEWGPFANSMYLFFSASANGTLRMGQVIKSNPARAAKVAGAFAAAGYGLAALNRAWGGKDDEDGKEWWDKQSDANKQRYAMIQHSDGETTRLPLAPGWGWFFYAGVQLEKAINDKKPVDMGDMVSSLAAQVSPVGGGSLAQVVSPWFLDPFVQTSENKDFKGDPIYRDKFPGEHTPYSSMPDNRSSDTAKAISKLANEVTGGTESREGGVDIPPRALDYVAGEAGSGLGRFVQRAFNVAKSKIKGESNLWREWPILSRFKGDAPDTYSRDFYANLDRIAIEEKAAKAGEKFDSKVIAQKERARRFKKAIEDNRDAGNMQEAKRLQAAFNKGFPK